MLSNAALSRGVIIRTLLLILNEALLGMHNRGPNPILLGRILLFMLIPHSTLILVLLLTAPLVLCVMFARNGESVYPNCLLDTGSRQTYLSSEVLKPLKSLQSIGLDCKFKLIYTPWSLR